MTTLNIKLPKEQLTQFCARWRVVEFSFFGSVLRDDFGPDSDVDVMVSFAPEARWSLFDHVEMQEELRALFGRDVDLVTRKGIQSSRNADRRDAILAGAETVDVAG